MSKSFEKDFADFCSTTSAHGFNYLTTPSKTVKFSWVLILIFALSFGIFHLYTLISQYAKYEYHESIVINTEQIPVFPDVTVCDNTGISDSSLER